MRCLTAPSHYLNQCWLIMWHYNDVIMSAMTSKSPASRPFVQAQTKEKNQSSASLALVRGINRWPVNSPHKGPVTRKMFPFDDVIMNSVYPKPVNKLINALRPSNPKPKHEPVMIQLKRGRVNKWKLRRNFSTIWHPLSEFEPWQRW